MIAKKSNEIDEDELSSLLCSIANIENVFPLIAADEDDADEELLEKMSEEEIQAVVDQLHETRLKKDWIDNANDKVGIIKAAKIGKKLLKKIQKDANSANLNLNFDSKIQFADNKMDKNKKITAPKNQQKSNFHKDISY